MAVPHTAVDEFRLHRIDDVFLLLTHRLTQGVTLTSGEVSQQSREQHYLLLIHRDAIGILQVFLHHGDIVGNRLVTVLTTDELRDITHRSRTIEGVHSDKVLEDGGLQFAQVFPHTVRLKLERADGATFLIELVGIGIVDGNGVEIDLNAACTLDILASLLQLRECLQTEEVHLDQSRRFNHVTVILCTVRLHALEVRIVGGGHRHPVGDRVATDDEATGVDTRSPHRSLQHLRILDGVGEVGVWRGLRIPQFGHIFQGVGQVHLRRLAVRTIRQTIRNSLTEGVTDGDGHLLHTRHILDGVLRGHRGVGDDMGTVLVTVFVFHPFQHASSAVIVEVGMVRIKETLKQKVVLQRVDLRDT